MKEQHFGNLQVQIVRFDIFDFLSPLFADKYSLGQWWISTNGINVSEIALKLHGLGDLTFVSVFLDNLNAMENPHVPFPYGSHVMVQFKKSSLFLSLYYSMHGGSCLAGPYVESNLCMTMTFILFLMWMFVLFTFN